MGEVVASSGRRWFATVRYRMWRRGLSVATATVAIGALTVPLAVAQQIPQYHYTGSVWSPGALPATSSVPVHPLGSVPAKAVLTKGQKPITGYTPSAPVWPAASTGTVAAAKGAVPVKDGTAPVWVAPATPTGARAKALAAAGGKPAVPASVRVQVAGHAQTLAAGADGLLVGFSRADGVATAGQVAVTLDYSSIAKAYGGGWGSRLHLVQVPACALTTPQLAACRTQTPLASQNLAGAEQLTATLTLKAGSGEHTLAAGANRSAASAASMSPMTAVEVISGTGGSQGNYAASTLSSSGAWGQTASGSFTYSYPVSVPAALGGAAPQVALSYNSQTADGETSARSSQGSPVGDSWSYAPGFIERSFRSCGSDGVDSLKKSGDQCWGGLNAVISLGSHNGVLVPDDTNPSDASKPQTWHLQGDDGTKVEELSGADNGVWNGTYFKVTTTDGTQYFLGANHAPDDQAGDLSPSPADDATDSAWDEPVYSPRSGDPCYNSTDGASSHCDMGYRFNLDFVVTPQGAVQRYDYGSEVNYYDRGAGQVADSNGSGTLTKYIRGGYLKQISYGYQLADEQAGHAPAAKVVFDNEQRCQTSSTFTDCSFGNLDADTATHWPDVPYDLNCPSTDSTKVPDGATKVPDDVCVVSSPTFWSTYRLNTITTYVQVGSTPTKVDSYQLNQVYSDAGGITDPVTGTTVDPKDAGALQAVMWLQSVTHTGWDTSAGGSTSLTTNAVTFTGTEIDNRVDGLTPAAPPLYHPRIATISTETGEEIAVDYYAPDCSRVDNTMPASADSDTMSCYQDYWTTPGGVTPIKDWFNKIRVQTVVVSDLTGASKDTSGDTVYSGSEAQVTNYSYSGAAWHRDDSALTDDQYRTWNQFRGYRTVTVRTGTAPEPVTQMTTTYLQGMDGDYKADGSKRSVQVSDSVGDTVTDADWMFGTPLEADSYTGSGGTVVARTVNGAPASTPTATAAQTAWTSKDPAPSDLSTLPPLTARRTTSSEQRSYALLADGTTWRETQSDTTFDSHGRPSQVDAKGDVSDASQERCTTTTYAAPPAANPMMLAFPDEVVQLVGSCATAKPGNGVTLSDQQLYYDGDGTLGNLGDFGKLDQTWSDGSTHNGGLVSASRVMTGYSGSTVQWQVPTALSYDSYGRTVKALDVNGAVTRTGYSPATGTLPTQVTSTNSQGWQTVSTVDPLRGVETEVKDVNGRLTDYTYDALGRKTAVWTPGRDKKTQTADETFSYLVSASAPSSVTTSTLREDGSYAEDVTLYDGMLQPRQTQSTTADDSAGRLIADTFYDSHGWAVRSYAPYVDTTTSPSTTLAVPDAENQIPSESVTQYDGQGRAVKDQLYTMGAYQWQSTASYPGADETDSTDPAGGATTATFSDALGQTTSTVVKDTTGVVKLTPGKVIPSGTSLSSGSVRLTMQSDGNLVLSGIASGTSLWSSGTSGHPGAWATFQSDGNFVVYDTSRNVLWSSKTNGTGTVLQIQNDANLAVYNAAGTSVWSSGTGNQAAEADVTTHYTYDNAGHVHTVADTAGNTWTYQYDFLGRQISQTDPNVGTSTVDSYDDLGNELQTTDARGQTLSYGYDWAGRRVAEYSGPWSATPDPTKELASWAYDSLAKGYPTSSTRYVGGANGSAYKQAVTGYNTAYQPLGTTSTVPAADGFKAPPGTAQGAAGTVTFESDATYSTNVGQLSSTSFGADGGLLPETVGYQYDLQGLLKQSGGTLTQSGGATVQAPYLDNTNYTPLGQLLRSTYGVYGKQAVTTDAYDPATGRLASSSLNTQTSSTNAIDNTSYRYNQAGLVTAVSDVQSSGSAVTGTDTQCFTYNALQRLTTAWTDTAGITAAGVGATGGCNTGAPTTTSTVPIRTTTVGDTAGGAYWQDYSYDLLGDRTGVVNHDTTGNAANNTVQSTGYAGSNATKAAALPNQAGPTVTTGPSGTATSTPGYNDPHAVPAGKNTGNTVSRATSTTGPLVVGVTASGGGRLCADPSGGHTTDGTAMTIWSCDGYGEQSFTVGTDGTVQVLGKCLDAVHSGLVNGTLIDLYTCNGSGAQQWKAATNGSLVNPESGRCLDDPNNSATGGTQLDLKDCNAGTGQHWATPTGAGATPAGQTQSLTYDAEGRTAAVTTPSGTGSQTSSYLYDADGGLLEQTSSSGTVILYLFGGSEQITQITATKSFTAQRFYAGPDGTTIIRTTGTVAVGTVTYEVSNVQGTGTTTIDATTLAVTRRAYDPYGNARGVQPGSWVDNRGYLGQPTDTSTGLDLLGARNYDPVQGRFLTPDPLFEAGDPNQMGGYAYSGDDPTSTSDPTGLFGWGNFGSFMTGFGDSWVGDVYSFTVNTGIDIGNGFYGLGYGVETWTPQGGMGTLPDADKIQHVSSHPLASLFGVSTHDGYYQGGEITGTVTQLAADGYGLIKVGIDGYKAVKAAREIDDNAGILKTLWKWATGGDPSVPTHDPVTTDPGKGKTGDPTPPDTGTPGTKTKAAGSDGVPGKTPSSRGAGSTRRGPVTTVIKADKGWTHAGQLKSAGDAVPGFALKGAKSGQPFSRTYVGGYHVETGDIALSSSGGLAKKGADGVVVGCSYCAEGNVVNALGGDSSKVRMTVAYEVQKIDNELVAVENPVCAKCQVDYPNPWYFVSGIKNHPGDWDKQNY